MKKALSCLLALLMLLTVMPMAFAESEAAYTYTYMPYSGIPETEDDPNWKLIQYIEDKYNIHFEFVTCDYATRDTQLSLLASSGELPDIMFATSSDKLYQQFVPQGLIATWDEEWFREVCPNLSAEVDQYTPGSWKMATFDGKMFTLPVIDYSGTFAEPVIWNVSWLEKLGLSIETLPDTLDGWEEVFYRFVNEDPDGNGVADTYAFSTTGLDVIYGAFGFQRNMWLDDGEGDVMFGDVMPAAKEALTLLAKWYQDGLIDPEFITGENQGGYWALSDAFINQRIGMTDHGHYYHWTDCTAFGIESLGSNPDAIAETDHPFKAFPSAPLMAPQGVYGIKIKGGINTRHWFNASLMDDMDRMTYLFKFMDDFYGNLDDQLYVCYGEEGVDYTYTEYAEGYKGIQKIDPDSKIGTGMLFGFANFCYEYSRLGDAVGTLYTDTYMGDYVHSGIINQVIATLPSQGTYQVECDKILAEGYIAIITGEKPIDYFDEMVEAWNNAGGAILTEEANEIYHAN